MKKPLHGVTRQIVRNHNASLADRIAEAKHAIKSKYSDPEKQQRILRRAKEKLANLPAKPTKPTPEDKVAHARASLAKAKAMLERAKKEDGYLAPKENHTFVTWQGKRIPIPKWNREDQW